jgi:hypothetical protein
MVIFLTSCTALNSHCGDVPAGDCWPDVNKCGIIQKKQYFEMCKYSDWHCGYLTNFNDP